VTTLVARPERARNAGQRHQGIAVAHFRLMLLMLLFIGGVAAVGGRLIWLTVFSDPAGRYGAASLLPVRGDITDRNGVPLARTMDAWSIGVHPQKLIGDKRLLAENLARLMPERSELAYYNILTSDLTFTYLRRRAMPEMVAAVNALGEPGMAFAREPERLYPQTTLAAHVLGYTDFDGRGVAGMERVLDAELTGPMTRGKGAALSIDSRVQAAMESELQAAVVKHSAIGATGIVLDVDTGEVIAMASLPVFNPNAVGQTPPDARRNNVTQSVYELGSTFKPLTVANAIENGVVTSMSKKYDASAPLQVGRFRISDFKGQNRPLNVPETLVYSSNIVTARIADEIGQARTESFYRKLGFDTAPDIELREKGRPLWPTYWGRTTVMTIGYGHGMAVTPLHLASAYAAMVNGGIWRPATLLKRDPKAIPAGRRVMAQSTSDRMRQLIRMVVLEGSGKNANAAGMRVGGKTGTAEKPSKGGYARKSLVSTFASAFPMDKPRYVVITMLDEPKGTADTYGYATAGWTAAPVAGRLIARIGPMLGVIPDERKDIDVSDVMPLVWKPKGGR
jgi:cell division protein FtsI (penicillin-binding protein 3)